MFTAEDDKDAEQGRARLIRRLKKNGQPKCRRLARQISRCTGRTGNTGCGSGACPRCGSALQRAAVRLCNETIARPARGQRGRATAITIVPSTGCVAPDELSVELCRRVLAEVRLALRSPGMPPTIMGLDISFNEDLTGEMPPHWSVHAHGVAQGWLSKRQRRQLRQCFLPSSLVRRPVRIEPLDGKDEGRKYPWKWQRFRRQRYLVTPKHRGPYKDTRAKSLRPAQSVMLALVEHRLGLAAKVMGNGANEVVTRALLARLRRVRDGP